MQVGLSEGYDFLIGCEEPVELCREEDADKDQYDADGTGQ